MKVVVGKDGQEFWAHETLLCGRSEFFRRALNGHWAEADENIVRLPEDKPEAFERYLEALYTNILSVSGPISFAPLAEVYVLAEKLVDIDTKNTIMRAMLTYSKNWMAINDTIKILYAGTPPSSPARRLVVESFANGIPKDEIRPIKGDYPEDFWVELVEDFVKRRDQGTCTTKLPHGRPEDYMEKVKDGVNDSR